MDRISDSDDEEAQIANLRRLTAVIEAEEVQPSTSGTCSQNSFPENLCSTTSKVQEDFLNVQNALSLNILTDEKMQKLESLLNLRLSECREKLTNEQSSPGTSTDNTDKNFKYINCGRPYFKGPDNFPAPDNEDTILMEKSHMYDFSTITSMPGWTVKDKIEFITTIVKMSIDIKKKQLNSKISQLQRESKNKKGKRDKTNNSLREHIAEIRKEIYGLDKKLLTDLALPLDEEYDWDMVAKKNNYRHNAQEYRALWKLFLHPSINKNSWSNTEHENLQRIALANELQDWDKIADQLGTGRTAYQCFVYFRTNISNTSTGQKWSKHEEGYLKRLIEYYREDDHIPWGKVSFCMKNRTKVQIYNKYLRLMEQRKGRFLPEEDAVILTCVKKFGPNFRRVMKYLPSRSMAQLRARHNVLSTGSGTKTSIVWTADEDKKLIQFMANQDSTLKNYSSLTKYFPGKDRAHIRARYITLVKWMRKHPNMDISKAPRRGARRLGHGVASQDLKNAVEKLKNRMQSVVESKKSTKLTVDSPHEAIDAALIAAIINDMNKAEEEKKLVTCDTEQTVVEESWDVPKTPPNVANLEKTLILLKAKLDKRKFQNSPFGQMYPELLQESQERSVLVKSYSKNATVDVLNIEKPDIWGNKTLSTTEYVFPPNYSTITACRKLMAYASTIPDNTQPMQLSLLARRNVLLKEQLDLLRDRFNVLFLWPILLSNVSPYTTPVPRGLKIKPPPVKTLILSVDPGIAIPNVGTHIVNENIDLTESNKEEKDITVKDVYIGNDDYMFMKH